MEYSDAARDGKITWIERSSRILGGSEIQMENLGLFIEEYVEPVLQTLHFIGIGIGPAIEAVIDFVLSIMMLVSGLAGGG